MDGFFPFLPLNPHHPRADVEAMAEGFKKEIPFSECRKANPCQKQK